MREALEASGHRAAGLFDEYDEYQFRETYGNEREELSDTESEGEVEAEAESNGRMAVDHVPSPKKDNDHDDNVGEGKGPFHLSTHGVVNGLALSTNESAVENDSGGSHSNTQENDTSNGDRENHEKTQGRHLD